MTVTNCRKLRAIKNEFSIRTRTVTYKFFIFQFTGFSVILYFPFRMGIYRGMLSCPFGDIGRAAVFIETWFYYADILKYIDFLFCGMCRLLWYTLLYFRCFYQGLIDFWFYTNVQFEIEMLS